MFTIFTMMRPMVKEFLSVQTNSLLSWTKLHQDVEILVYGLHESKVRDFIAKENRLTGIEDEGFRSKQGSLLVNKVLNHAYKSKANDVLVMANSDNLYFSDFTNAITKLDTLYPEFVAVGRRINVDYENRFIDFSNETWQHSEKSFISETGKLHGAAGADFFIIKLKKNYLKDMLDFRVGRTRYDNHMLWRFSQLNIPLVNISKAVLVGHQNHSWTPKKDTEGNINRALVPKEQRAKLSACTHELVLDENKKYKVDKI